MKRPLPDLRMVAEQIIKPRAKYSTHEVPVYLGHESRRDDDGDVRLARAWLAEHPADGQELQTHEWLRTVGFAADGNDELPDAPLAYDLFYGRDEDGIANGTDNGRHILIDKAGDVLLEEYKPNGDVVACIDLPHVTTRDDVRRLMLGFGVSLAPTPAPTA